MFIDIRQLIHRYPVKRDQARPPALDRLDLQIDRGTFFVMTGPNGGGKSTLFKILCGLLQPSAGQVFVDGHDSVRESAAVRRLMGVVFQKPALDPQLTVMENLQIHADMYGMSRAAFQQRLSQTLGWTGLEKRMGQVVKTLSGGLARQVELVKVLLHAPPLIMMDEPTTGLDPGSRHAFMQALRTIQKQENLTILLTSHIFSEAEVADRMAILQNGQLLAADSPARLKAALGGNVVVIQTRNPDALEAELKTKPGLTVHRRDDELRVEGGDPRDLVAELLAIPRGIHHLSIKEPTLEDVFIHLTGRSLEQVEAETQQLGQGGQKL
ncbi:MAG: ABC transporter ATP-binding protein [Magnetococcales bacterium]|nr:ABC transporter ATP-binding protein [Magnetococcales bacterium]MBF0322774.1 ABC transporter ATP-binding protein [Magnetococcales bacterium]